MRAALPSSSAVVIGGGIVGLLTAFELLRAGVRVTLLERGALARQASWAGGGLLSPLYPWRVEEALWMLAAESMAMYPALCEQLFSETGIDPEWAPSGLLMFDADQIEPGRLWADQQGLESAIVTAGVGPPALHMPWVAQVRNPRLCQAVVAALQQRGVTLVQQAGEVRLRVTGGRAAAVTEQCEWQADHIVVCAGAWTAGLLDSVGWMLPIRPVRGQMLLLRGAAGQIPSILLRDGRYLIPRRDGRVLVGSTIENVGFEQATTAAARQELLSFAKALVPACGEMPIEAHWAGLRPGSPEGIPVIAQHPSVGNLYVNAGHHRYGLTMAPASARRLVDLLDSNATLRV